MSGATGSSPQAVILFGSGHANFSDAAVAPEGFAAHESFGDATGQAESDRKSTRLNSSHWW